MRRAAARGICLLVAAIAWAAPAAGQSSDRADEARFLREAASREGAGDYRGAEEVLRGLLSFFPASSGGLFALERVLRAQGRVGEVLPVADRVLEAEPDFSGARHLRLRVLVEIDSLEAVEEEAGRWLERESRSPEAYREIAGVYEQAFGPERALALLREGRARLADSAALAVDIGDLLARSGRTDEAVAEWSLALGPDGSGVTMVERRLMRLPGDTTGVARALLAAVDAEPTTAERRAAAVRIGLEAGLVEEALALAGKAVAGLEGSARAAFLGELARRGEAAGSYDVTLWAYQALRDAGEDASALRDLNVRIAGAALAAGDTARALETQRRLVRELPRGSAERRRVLVDLIRIEARREGPGEVLKRLEDFRREFPDAHELDALASGVAAGLHARGETASAREALAGVVGPASDLQRAYLLLDDGDLEAGREALGAAVRGLSPTEATEVVQLLGLLDRLGPDASAVVARSAVRRHVGDPSGAVDLVTSALDGLPEGERSAVLAHAARAAEAGGDPGRAADLRRRLLDRHPRAPEVAEATVALARHRAASPDGVAEAVTLLETLILERPDSPVVPDARRELQRLKGRIPGGGR